jgi:hypothetical protein
MLTATTQPPSPDRILAVLIQSLFDPEAAATRLHLQLEAFLPLLRSEGFKQVLAEHLALTRQLAELRAGAALPNAINILERSSAHPDGPEHRKVATTIIRACSIARPRGGAGHGSPSPVRPRAGSQPPPKPTEQDTHEAAALIRSLLEPITPVSLAPRDLSARPQRPQIEVPPQSHRKQHTPVQRVLQRNGAC